MVKLEKWVEGTEYDRLGITGETYECLGVRKPYIRLPVVAARNLALLVEIAARNHLMKLQGVHSAADFAKRVEDEIARTSAEEEEKSRFAAGWSAPTRREEPLTFPQTDDSKRTNR